jgi:prepilin-type N-terminal cleavage/methylation domain-containing protein
MNMKKNRKTSVPLQAGFTILELALVVAILSVVLGAVFSGISTTIARSQSEQSKVDLTQQGREFVDEFERDLHQAGYPNCRMVSTTIGGVATGCPTDFSTLATQAVAENSALAVGLVYVSYTKVIFEGGVDGSGTVYNIQYRLVDGNGNWPPTTSCPCTIQRSEVKKDPANLTLPWIQAPVFTQELPNVVNSGSPAAGGGAYGGGLTISGNTEWGATNAAYYAALTTFKDYPVFQAYDQSGNIIDLSTPLNLNTAGATQTLTCSVSTISCVKSIRLTLNLLGNANTSVDTQTKVRPVTTFVGNARLVNN